MLTKSYGRFALGVLLAIALGLVSTAVRAQEVDSQARLDSLFGQLRTAGSPEKAQAIEAAIWKIWTHTGVARIDAQMETGVRALDRRDLAKALESFDLITHWAPDYAEGWNKRATVLYLMGDFGRSIQDIGRTLDLEPRHFGAISGLSLIYSAMEEHEAALEFLERLVQIHPRMAGLQTRIKLLRKRVRGDPV